MDLERWARIPFQEGENLSLVALFVSLWSNDPKNERAHVMRCQPTCCDHVCLPPLTEILFRFNRVCRKDDPMSIVEALPNGDFRLALLKEAKHRKYFVENIPRKAEEQQTLLIRTLQLSAVGAQEEVPKPASTCGGEAALTSKDDRNCVVM